MTTLAQPGYEQAKGVLQMLAATARKEFDYGAFACFGTNAEITAAGTVSVGDTLTVLRLTNRSPFEESADGWCAVVCERNVHGSTVAEIDVGDAAGEGTGERLALGRSGVGIGAGRNRRVRAAAAPR